jgi:hypothetical protein
MVVCSSPDAEVVSKSNLVGQKFGGNFVPNLLADALFELLEKLNQHPLALFF